MEIYLLRHGTTAWNKELKLQGSTDIDLDEDGIRLAKETGEAIEDVHFDACYSSPLKRAVDTAKYVLRDRDIPIIEDYRLSEVNFGDWEGRDCSKTSTEIPPHATDRFFDLKQEPVSTPHGENVQQVLDRTKSFFDEIVDDPENENKRILLSMHGASGRALMHAVWKDNNFWHGSVPPNCSITIIKLKDKKVVSVKKDCVFYGEEVHDYYGAKS